MGAVRADRVCEDVLERRARASFVLSDCRHLKAVRALNARHHPRLWLLCSNRSLLNLGQARSQGVHSEGAVLEVTCFK